MRIRTKLVLILLAVSVVPVVGIAVVARNVARESLERQIGNHSLEYSKLAIRRINEHLYHCWQDV